MATMTTAVTTTCNGDGNGINDQRLGIQSPVTDGNDDSGNKHVRERVTMT